MARDIYTLKQLIMYETHVKNDKNIQDIIPNTKIRMFIKLQFSVYIPVQYH
jgi:hypothetical protein